MGAAVVGLAVGVALWPRPAETPQFASQEPNPTPSPRPARSDDDWPLGAPSPSVISPIAPSALARFEGDVVDNDGMPLNDVSVAFHRYTGNGELRVRTDSLGRFRVEVEEGEWFAMAEAPGHIDETGSARLFAVAGTVVSGLRLVLSRSRSLTGLVVDERGAAVADAGISLGTEVFPGFERVRTDSNGRFTTELGETTEQNVILVTHECCFDERQLLPSEAGPLQVTVRLRRVELERTVFNGIVVDGHDLPVAGAEVMVSSMLRFDAGLARREASAQTDSQGRFAVGVPGEVVTAVAFHHLESSEPVQLHPGTLTKLVLDSSDATISGRVSDESGRPITRFRVEVDNAEPRMEGWVDVLSGDGRFVIERLMRGRKTVQIEADGFADPTDREVSLEAGQHLGGINFVLSRGRALSGRVTDERTGAGLADAGVRGGGKGTRTDAHGQFVLAALPLTTVDLEGDFGEGYVDRMVQVKAGNPEPVLIALRARESDDGGYRRDYEGIGVQLDFDRVLDGGNGYPVLRLLPTGGAHAAGVLVGDEVLAADDTKAGALPFEDFNSLIKGPAGTAVKLTIRRDGREFDVRVSRKRLAW